MHHLLRWYLLGWDLDREDWRVFRTDRTAVSVALDSWHWLLVHLASLDADFTVTEAPARFVAEWRTFARRLL